VIGTSFPKRIVPAVNFENRWGEIRPSILIMHYTGMRNAEDACRWLCNEDSKVSCHYLVDEAGAIIQMVSEDKRAWHAGVSWWKGASDLNSRSIGIEIQNPGHTGGYPDFPRRQMEAVAALGRDIVQRWAIAAHDVLAHSDVAPGRKVDPGEKFDWRYLSEEGVGIWLQPEPLSDGPRLAQGNQGPDVEELQYLLDKYGYGVEKNGVFDTYTRQATAAFQRHFRPARVDGVADVSTVATLKRLVAMI
jgi:N-acetylmuramoyl-L-alanine amidase